MIEKLDGALDFQAPARAVHDQARGFYPWPGAFTALPEAVSEKGSEKTGVKRVKIHRTRVHATTGDFGVPGTIVAVDAAGLLVACGQGALRIEELQPDGRKRMHAQAFAAGYPSLRGVRFVDRAGLVS
jgi:methionyl-tRNA formyltransferase